MSLWKSIRISKSAVAILVTLFLVQCSDEGPSKDVAITPYTKSPLIRVSKRTVGTFEVQPNWFDYDFAISNGSQQDLRIEDVLFYVYVDGNEPSTAHSFDLGSLTKTDDDGNTYAYPSYCIYPAGTELTPLHACQGSNVEAGAGGTPFPLSIKIKLYIGSIEKQDSGLNVYRVQLKVIGVFVDDSGFDTDRFEKSLYFSTR